MGCIAHECFDARFSFANRLCAGVGLRATLAGPLTCAAC